MKFVAKTNKDLITDFLELSTKELSKLFEYEKIFWICYNMFGQIYTYPERFQLKS